MLNPNITEIISLSYSALGQMCLKIVRNIDKGYGKSQTQNELWARTKKLRKVLKAVLDHVVFDATTGKVIYTLHTSDATMNKFCKVLVDLSGIQDYSTAPVLFSKVKPQQIIFNQPGATGPPGQPGQDATVDVIADTGELQIIVNPVTVLGIKTFKLSFVPYSAPQLSVSIDAPKIYEIGKIVAVKTITITTTKGSKTILTLTISDAGLNTFLQSILNFGTLNGVTQPQVTSLNPVSIAADVTYTVTLTDNSGLPAGTVVKSDSIKFVYPFLYGASDNQGDNPYLVLTKLLEVLGNKVLNLNGTVKYFWIGYPASYGPASQILDQNGFDAIGAFDTFTQNVTSIGLDNNYTVSYRFYRTTAKTTILNKNYTLKF